MEQFSQKIFIECLDDKDNFIKKFKEIKEQFLNANQQFIYKTIVKIKDILNNKNNEPLRKFQALRMIKQGLQTCEYGFIVLVQIQIIPILKKVAQYKRTQKQQNKGKSYFLENIKDPIKKEQYQKYGINFLKLTLEILDIWPKIKPNFIVHNLQIEELESQFTKSWNQLKSLNVIFPANYSYFKTSDKENIRKKFLNRLETIFQGVQKYEKYYNNLINKCLEDEKAFKDESLNHIRSLFKFGQSFVISQSLNILEKNLLQKNTKSITKILSLKLLNQMFKLGEVEVIEMCLKIVQQFQRLIQNIDNNDKSLKRGQKIFMPINEENKKNGKIFYIELCKTIMLWADCIETDLFSSQIKQSKFKKVVNYLKNQKKYEFPMLTEDQIKIYKAFFNSGFKLNKIKNTIIIQLRENQEQEEDGGYKSINNQGNFGSQFSGSRLAIISKIQNQKMTERYLTLKNIFQDFNKNKIKTENEKQDSEWLENTIKYMTIFSQTFQNQLKQVSQASLAQISNQGRFYLNIITGINQKYKEYKNKGLKYSEFLNLIQKITQANANIVKNLEKSNHKSKISQKNNQIYKKSMDRRLLIQSKIQQQSKQQNINKQNKKKQQEIIERKKNQELIKKQREQQQQKLRKLQQQQKIKKTKLEQQQKRLKQEKLQQQQKRLKEKQQQQMIQKQQREQKNRLQKLQQQRIKKLQQQQLLKKRKLQQQLRKKIKLQQEEAEKNKQKANKIVIEKLQNKNIGENQEEEQKQKQNYQNSEKDSGMKKKNDQSQKISSNISSSKFAKNNEISGFSHNMVDSKFSLLQKEDIQKRQSKEFRSLTSIKLKKQENNIQGNRLIDSLQFTQTNVNSKDQVNPPEFEINQQKILIRKLPLPSFKPNISRITQRISQNAPSLLNNIKQSLFSKEPTYINKQSIESKVKNNQYYQTNNPNCQKSEIIEPQLQPLTDSYYQLKQLNQHRNKIINNPNPQFKECFKKDKFIFPHKMNKKKQKIYWIEQDSKLLNPISSIKSSQSAKKQIKVSVPQILAEKSHQYNQQLMKLETKYKIKIQILEAKIQQLEKQAKLRESILEYKNMEIQSLKQTISQISQKEYYRQKSKSVNINLFQHQTLENQNLYYKKSLRKINLYSDSSKKTLSPSSNPYYENTINLALGKLKQPKGKLISSAPYQNYLIDFMDQKIRKNMLKNKQLLFKNNEIEIGSIFSKDETSLKLNLFIQSQINVNDFKLIIAKHNTLNIQKYPEKLPDKLIALKQQKIMLIIQIPIPSHIPYALPTMQISYSKQYDETYKAKITLPCTFNKFFDFKQIQIQQLKQIFKNKKQKIIRGQQIAYNKKILKDYNSIKQYLPRLVLLNKNKEAKFLQGKSNMKFACTIGYKNFTYLLKVNIKPNHFLYFQSINLGVITNQSTKAIQFFICTLNSMFGRQKSWF